ncbi:MFS transporter [Shewanella dokdonensis]|uniref:MFS transporter n=1 Tax=Shewanella dokdonensis TaxID=712036 RepID=UPI00200DE875|nr:MFS transporter [Shewanella dokdonensis]MCL1075545.1 MFS transporter [Shewanella dokdonensis]
MPETSMRPAAATPAANSAFAPFYHKSFAVLWVATVLSNVGTWMHDVGAGWLMTSMAPSPVMVALVQTATTLPLFLFALPAGAIADIVDKRKLLLLVQSVLAITALTLAYIVANNIITPWLLLIFTFVMGIGAALTAPAWQAIVPSLVPKPVLQQAVAANSVGINISRAIGPAVGGTIISLSIALPFLFNGLSFLLVIAAVFWWSPPKVSADTIPKESFWSAIRAGVRYARHSQPLKTTLIRALGFFLFASAYWALLPLIARQVLAGDANLYGMMMGAVGLGAVAGAFTLPKMKSLLGADKLVAAGTIGTAICMLVLATSSSHTLAIAVCLLAGMSWIAVLTSLNVSAQVALPEWVRARGLAIFVTVFFGAMSAGSLFWGNLSAHLGIPTVLCIAAVGALLVIPLTWRAKLQLGVDMDLSQSLHWPEPTAEQGISGSHGPVMVMIEYLIDPLQNNEFYSITQELKRQRHRDGAYAWGVFADTSQPGRYLEYFLVQSWHEHLRQHHRVTRSDQALQAKVLAFHLGPKPPKVEHFVAIRAHGEGDIR